MKRWVNIHGQETKKARIEIIPMIDTIFFLLVFFMFTSLSMVKMKAMGVNLPKDSASVQKPPPKDVVTVTRAGDWFVNTLKVPPSALQNTLQGDVTAKPDTVVIVNVDNGQPVQTLVDVMDDVNNVHLPSGDVVPVMISSENIDANGNAASPGAQP